MRRRHRTIVLGVTVAHSLRLMDGLPQYLVEQGWHVHLVTSPGSRLEPFEGVDGITVHTLPMRRDPSPFADLKALCRWVVLLLRVRPAILMVGTPKAGLLGLLSGWICRVPARIYHVRGLRLETANGRLRVVLSVLERAAFAASTSALAVSKSLRDRVVELGLVRDSKVTVLGRGSSNGVDTERFRPSTDRKLVETLASTLGLRDDVPIVGYIGRIHRDKGLDTLAMASVKLHQQDVGHQLLVVGRDEMSGDNPLAPLEKIGRPAVVTGAVEDTSRYYHLMDVLCLPTLREGFPNVVLESGASGVPVITTTATGAVDSIVDHVTGRLTAPGDPRMLTDRLHEVLADDALRQEMGAAAREHTVQHFDRRVVWQAVGDYLDERVARGAPDARHRAHSLHQRKEKVNNAWP